MILWISNLKSNKVETKLLYTEDVCVDKRQFLKMVQNANNESEVFTVSFTTSDGNGSTAQIITR